MMLVHHDDAVREFAYGAESKIGTFSDALMTEAKKNDWTVISMKNDWKVIFPFESKWASRMEEVSALRIALKSYCQPRQGNTTLIPNPDIYEID